MTEKKRMANVELLRCIAMMMVVVLHYLGKGYLLPNMAPADTGEPFYMGITGTIAWILEAFAIVAVNIYMLISGYFLAESSFKLSRLLQLLIQVWLYSVVFGVLAAVTGVVVATPVDTHYYLTLLCPISMEHYWFLTAYVFLYICLPLIGTAVRNMTQKQHFVTCVVLLIAFSGLKSVLPFCLETDRKGYDFIWYLCVFLVAAYIRKYGIPVLESKKNGLILYLLCVVLTVAVTYGLRFVYLKTGSLALIVTNAFHYNHILTLLGAVGLFCAFLKVKVSEKADSFICKIAPYTLGVLLLHENIGLRYTWQNWLGADRVNGLGGLILGTLIAVVVIFTCGIVVDMLRKKICDALHVLLNKIPCYNKIMKRIEQIDSYFAERK